VHRCRREQALLKTLRNRPDLLQGAALSASDRTFLEKATRETKTASS
jgi:tRNA G37 N-methylase TrmD